MCFDGGSDALYVTGEFTLVGDGGAIGIPEGGFFAGDPNYFGNTSSVVILNSMGVQVIKEFSCVILV